MYFQWIMIAVDRSGNKPSQEHTVIIQRVQGHL